MNRTLTLGRALESSGLSLPIFQKRQLQSREGTRTRQKSPTYQDKVMTRTSVFNQPVAFPHLTVTQQAGHLRINHLLEHCLTVKICQLLHNQRKEPNQPHHEPTTSHIFPPCGPYKTSCTGLRCFRQDWGTRELCATSLEELTICQLCRLFCIVLYFSRRSSDSTVKLLEKLLGRFGCSSCRALRDRVVRNRKKKNPFVGNIQPTEGVPDLKGVGTKEPRGKGALNFIKTFPCCAIFAFSKLLFSHFATACPYWKTADPAPYALFYPGPFTPLSLLLLISGLHFTSGQRKSAFRNSLTSSPSLHPAKPGTPGDSGRVLVAINFWQPWFIYQHAGHLLTLLYGCADFLWGC